MQVYYKKFNEPSLSQQVTLPSYDQSEGGGGGGDRGSSSRGRGRDGFLEWLWRQDDVVSPELTFLGTGSTSPTTERSLSSIYFDTKNNHEHGLETASRSAVLIDCGEGTHGQLLRVFGEKGTEDAIRRLACVWVSHKHADHHCGEASPLPSRCGAAKAMLSPSLLCYRHLYSPPMSIHSTTPTIGLYRIIEEHHRLTKSYKWGDGPMDDVVDRRLVVVGPHALRASLLAFGRANQHTGFSEVSLSYPDGSRFPKLVQFLFCTLPPSRRTPLWTTLSSKRAPTSK